MSTVTSSFHLCLKSHKANFRYGGDYCTYKNMKLWDRLQKINFSLILEFLSQIIFIILFLLLSCAQLCCRKTVKKMHTFQVFYSYLLGWEIWPLTFSQGSQVSYLPTHRVFPIQVKAIKVMLLDELNDVVSKLLTSSWIVDKSAVFPSEWVIPATNGNEHFHPFGPQAGNLLIEFCQEIQWWNYEDGIDA